MDDIADKIDDVVDQTLPYERDAFLWLNDWHTEFLDVFMMTFSGKVLWIPLTVVLLLSLFYKTKWTHAVLFIVCFAVLATLCDQLSAGVIKPFFERYRPTHHPDFMDYVQTVDNYRGGRFGFISAHAANSFGIATFISLVYRYKWLTLTVLLWAFVNSYSRIYLGVHFITDILGGILLGAVAGFLVYLLYQFGRVRVLKQTVTEVEQPVYTHTHGNIIIVMMIGTVLVNIVYSLGSIYG